MIQKTRVELKTEIKQLFKGRWKDAILLCIIISLLTIFGVMANYSDRMSAGSSTSDSAAFKQLGALTGTDISLILAVMAGFLLVQVGVWLVVQIFRMGRATQCWTGSVNQNARSIQSATQRSGSRSTMAGRWSV